MASFDFLASENVDDDDDDDEDDDGMANGDSYDGRDTRVTAEQLLANRLQVLYPPWSVGQLIEVRVVSRMIFVVNNRCLKVAQNFGISRGFADLGGNND